MNTKRLIVTRRASTKTIAATKALLEGALMLKGGLMVANGTLPKTDAPAWVTRTFAQFQTALDGAACDAVVVDMVADAIRTAGGQCVTVSA